MIEIIVGTILIVLGPVVDGFVYGLTNLLLFPLVALLLVRTYNFKIAIVVVTIVSLALDLMLHLNIGSILLCLSGVLIIDFLIGLVIPKEDMLLFFINNFLNFLVFNVLLVVFRTISFEESLSQQFGSSSVLLIVVSSFVMAILYIAMQGGAQALRAKDRGHTIRLR